MSDVSNGNTALADALRDAGVSVPSRDAGCSDAKAVEEPPQGPTLPELFVAVFGGDDAPEVPPTEALHGDEVVVVSTPEPDVVVPPTVATQSPSLDAGTGRKPRDGQKKHGGAHSPMVIPQLRVASAARQSRPLPPRGTLQPSQLFSLTAYQAADVARKIAGKGEHPEVVLYTPTESGYDVLRIAVMAKSDAKKASLTITSASGSYTERFGRAVGDHISLDELAGRETVPSQRVALTIALHDVLAEVIAKIEDSVGRKQKK